MRILDRARFVTQDGEC